MNPKKKKGMELRTAGSDLVIDKNQAINWYEKLGDEIQKPPRLDKNFKKHYILPCSMILSIGGTGSGKTNALMTFLMLKNESFYTIILYTGSTSEEPLYDYLKKKIPDMEIYTDISLVPSLNEFDDDDKKKEKLIIFDDFINLKKPEMIKINQYLTAGRKFGFTVWLQAQNYVSVSKTITRNINYFIIFRLNDNVSINNIIKNHNIDDLDRENFKEAYKYATQERLNFFIIDLKGDKSKRLRHNFLGFLSV
jgi:hypothetical protein